VARDREAIRFRHALANAVHPLISLLPPVEALYPDGSDGRVLGHLDSVTRAVASCQPCQTRPPSSTSTASLGSIVGLLAIRRWPSLVTAANARC
jgi:hypothetical protein